MPVEKTGNHTHIPCNIINKIYKISIYLHISCFQNLGIKINTLNIVKELRNFCLTITLVKHLTNVCTARWLGWKECLKSYMLQMSGLISILCTLQKNFCKLLQTINIYYVLNVKFGIKCTQGKSRQKDSFLALCSLQTKAKECDMLQYISSQVFVSIHSSAWSTLVIFLS